MVYFDFLPHLFKIVQNVQFIIQRTNKEPIEPIKDF